MQEYQQQYGGLGMGLGQQGIGRVNSTGGSGGAAAAASGGSGGGRQSTNASTPHHLTHPPKHSHTSRDRGGASTGSNPHSMTTMRTTKSPNILRELRKTSATLLHTFASETLTATR